MVFHSPRPNVTGLDYFGARYYSGAQGRFTTPDEFPGGIVDPITGQQVGQPGPLPYADISNPQTLNKYGYVRNNPLRFVDPDGHADDSLVKKWLDVLEAKVSLAVGYGATARAGNAEVKAGATLIGGELKGGLGGGNLDFKLLPLVGEFSAGVGPAKTKAKAGFELSSASGPSATGEAAGSVGGAGFAIGGKLTREGFTPAAGVSSTTDFHLGISGKAGIGVGVDINVSQIGRAWTSTVAEVQKAAQNINVALPLVGQPTINWSLWPQQRREQ